MLKKAEEGDSASQYEMGKILLQNKSKNEEAIKWLQLASNQNYSLAKVSLAVALINQSQPQYDEEIISLLLSAGEQGVGDAFFLLGSILMAGIVTLKASLQFPEGIAYKECIFKAAELGHDTSRFLIGQSCENGNLKLNTTGTIDYVEAIKWYQLSSTPQSIHNMACIYENGGYGIDQNLQMAYEFYLRSKDMGCDSSLMKLAKCFLYGDLGVELNYKEGHKILDILIAKDNMNAYKEKALCFLEGIGVPLNLPKACTMLEFAGYNGSIGAMILLAQYYDEGHPLIKKGSRLSYGKESLRWFALAYTTGFFPDAEKKFEECGMPDLSEGFQEFLQGFPYDLGTLTCPQNHLEAVRCYKMSLSKGFLPAKYRLKKLDPSYSAMDSVIHYSVVTGGVALLAIIGYKAYSYRRK